MRRRDPARAGTEGGPCPALTRVTGQGAPTLLLALVLLLTLACTGSGPSEAPFDPAALEIPHPDLSSFEPVIRERIEALQAQVERRRAAVSTDPEERRALGDAFGELAGHYHAFLLLGAAETCYAQAARLAPESHRWHYYLGAVLAHQGKEAEAATALERARDLAPDDLPTLLRLGDLYLRLARPGDAAATFAHAAEIDPQSPVAWFGLGKAAAAAGDHAAAVERFEKALELQPEATSIHYSLAQAYRRLGDLESAERHLALHGEVGLTSRDPLMERVLRIELDTAIDSIRSLAAQPERLSAEELVDFAAAQIGGEPAALEELRRAVAAGGGAESPAVAARLQFTVGSLLARTGDFAAAAPSLERALALDPGLRAAELPLVRALIHDGRALDALSRVDRLVAETPGDARARVERAAALSALGRDEEALAELRRAAAAEPEDGEVRLRLGVALERAGDLPAAARELEEALDLELPREDRALALHRLGEMLRRLGRTGEARRRYEEALEEDPTLLDARRGLAAALGQEGRYEEAVAAYREVLAERPDDVPARLGEAAALLLLGRNREARRRLEEGLEAAPGDPALAAMLARHLAACPDRSLRDGARALELASRVMAARPTFESAETLAMALAEVGHFDRAAAAQEELLRRARAAGDRAAAARLAANLDLYKRGRSCCAGP